MFPCGKGHVRTGINFGFRYVYIPLATAAHRDGDAYPCRSTVRLIQWGEWRVCLVREGRPLAVWAIPFFSLILAVE
jgi:hypothetical protein